MAQTLLAAPNDEIADLINLVRSASDPDVGLVLPSDSTALRTPLNARLLSQFSKRTGRRTAIVSSDPRVQEMARANGFRVYSSVPAYERGIEAFVAKPPPPVVGNGGAAPIGPTGEMAALVAAATATGPPAAPPAAGPAQSPLATPFAPPRADAPAPPAPPLRRPPLTSRATPPPASFFHRQRKKLYVAGGAAALIGLLLFFILSPSATITVTLAGAPLSVNPTIQGSTDPSQAKSGDHILTQVLSATGTGNFNASPTGQKTLPATAASGSVAVQFSGNTSPNGVLGQIPQGTQFQNADGSIVFKATQDVTLCYPASGQPACGSVPANNAVPVQDQLPEAKGNVAPGTLTSWPKDPCNPANNPSNNAFGNYQPECFDKSDTEHDYFSVGNPAATTGGADQRQETTASASDVANWQNQVQQVENTLTSQVNGQLQSQASGRSFAVDPNNGGKSLTFDVKPQLPSADSQFAATAITITANAKAVVYNPQDPKNDMLADIRAQVSQGDQLGTDSFKPGTCQVTQADVDGTVILSCSATGFSQPIVDLNGLRGQLTGKNPG
ncbi:MAG: hypothetical protein JOZ75_00980, partial [Candidatus Dormibacteraeota bacterium]|nr:hypothetical protein [Candidatus Dormibacteraeota bacterium]